MYDHLKQIFTSAQEIEFVEYILDLENRFELAEYLNHPFNKRASW